MDKVYIVTTGEYSDYQIYAVYDNQPQAAELVEHLTWESRNCGARIEEYTVNEENKPVRFIRVLMKQDGTTINTYHELDAKPGFQRYLTYEDGAIILIWDVNTEDEQRAIKVVNEKRVQILALGIWGDEAKTVSTLAQ